MTAVAIFTGHLPFLSPNHQHQSAERHLYFTKTLFFIYFALILDIMMLIVGVFLNSIKFEMHCLPTLLG